MAIILFILTLSKTALLLLEKLQDYKTFPDNYYFESASGRPSRTTAFKQIGNAVPVLLAEKIATALLEVW